MRSILLVLCLFCFGCKEKSQVATDVDTLPPSLPQHPYVPDDRMLGELANIIVKAYIKYQGLEECSVLYAKTQPLKNNPFAAESILKGSRFAPQYDVDGLSQMLFLSNKEKRTIVFETSCEKNGYVLSSKAGYDSYFESGNIKYAELIKNNPQIHKVIFISAPVYDAKSGGILVYILHTSGALDARGGIYLFKNENGELTEVSSCCHSMS